MKNQNDTFVIYNKNTGKRYGTKYGSYQEWKTVASAKGALTRLKKKHMKDYLDQFFPVLGIPDKYKQFVIDIINRADKKYLHINNESRTKTKCIGVIDLLTCRIPELRHIKKDTI